MIDSLFGSDFDGTSDADMNTLVMIYRLASMILPILC
jgi:hypothetical protein